LRPGGYDFARDLYFQRIGASGFVHGAIKVVTPPTAATVRMQANAFVQGVRDAIDFRIRSVLSGGVGSIASALITGKRDAIAPHVYDAMFVSGIGHVLSISGYHMAVVAGVVFFILRALLALIPGLADRTPIKKWAAFAALIVTAFYLVLSGAEVATQRSFIMIAIVLVGVMLDRPVLTLRTVTIAALLVLLFAPEAVVHPSFQMSFAATLALIATYGHGLPLARAGMDSSIGSRAALWGVNEVVSLIIASLVAGLATTPYAAYHFHRLAPYGVLSNLLAMPIVSAWVMPMGILGVLAIPFGFDAVFWRQMGYGIEWMDAVALWVASLPGAFGRVTAFGTGPLLLATAGLLTITLLKTPLRWSGVVFVFLAIVIAARTPVPDILVSADGRTFAVRGADGKLAFHHTSGDTFAMREWLAADADSRDVKDRGLGGASPAIRRGATGGLATDGSFPTRSRRTPSKKIAGAQPSSWQPAMSRPTATRPSSGAVSGANAGRWRYAATVPALSSRRRGRRISTGRGRRDRRERRASHFPTRQQIRPQPYGRRRAMRRRGRRTFSRTTERLNTAGTARPACPGYARGWAAGYAPRRRYWPAQAQWKRRDGGSA